MPKSGNSVFQLTAFTSRTQIMNNNVKRQKKNAVGKHGRSQLKKKIVESDL